MYNVVSGAKRTHDRLTALKGRLLVEQAFFSYMLYSTTRLRVVNDASFTHVAATDGYNILLNEDTFFAMQPSEQIFVLAHELLHVVFDHCGQSKRYAEAGGIAYQDGVTLPFDRRLANVAQDAVINKILDDARVGTMPRGGVFFPFVSAADGWVDVYRTLFKDEKAGGAPRLGLERPFDEHMDPADVPDDGEEAPPRPSPAQLAGAVREAMARAKAHGTLPAALERALGGAAAPPVDWREVLRASVQRVLGTGAYSWERPDRRMLARGARDLSRMVVAPGRAGRRVGGIVIAVDTSGSVAPAVLDVFAAAMSDILSQARPAWADILWCDAAIGAHHHVTDPDGLRDVLAQPVPGGGGTDFRPVFGWVEAAHARPDAVVYLTDLYGTFPAHQPDGVQTIWASISRNAAPPWGEFVFLDMNQ